MTPAQPVRYLAHAFGARYDLPIPLKLFVLGGALVVVLSFLVAERRAVSPSADSPAPDVTHLRKAGPTVSGSGAVSLLLLAFLVAVGVLGSQDIPLNIVPTSFWLVVWIMVPLTCGILGDWTQAVNPFAFLARLCDRPSLRSTIFAGEQLVGWPDRVGWWPAAALYFLTCCGELIVNKTATLPRVTALSLLVYGLVSAFCGMMFGRAWLQRGEVFTVLFSTWGRLGFWRFGAPGRRGFAGGLDVPFEPSPSRTAFVLLLLVSVNFDGLISTPHWTRITANLKLAAPDKSKELELFATVVFLAIALVVYAVFGAFAGLAARATGARTRFTAALADLLPSMLPIAFGYLLAHNLQYVLINGQTMAPLIGDPTGLDSWPLHLPYPFNGNFEPHVKFLPNAFYWYASVSIIIAVHIVAVVIAHTHLTQRSSGRTQARRGEYRWLVAMVAYTMLSLWLIAQPLVKETKTTSASPPWAPSVVLRPQASALAARAATPSEWRPRKSAV